MAGRKMERRLKCEVRFVVRVEVNWGVVSWVNGRGKRGAAAQFRRMVGWVENFWERVSWAVVEGGGGDDKYLFRNEVLDFFDFFSASDVALIPPYAPLFPFFPLRPWLWHSDV